MALRFDHCKLTVSSLRGRRELLIFFLMGSNENYFIMGQRICNWQYWNENWFVFKLKCMLLNLIYFNLWSCHSIPGMFFNFSYFFYQPCLHPIHIDISYVVSHRKIQALKKLIFYVYGKIFKNHFEVILHEKLNWSIFFQMHYQRFRNCRVLCHIPIKSQKGLISY